MPYRTYSPTITVSASPDYSAGDAVGSGYMTLTAACHCEGKATCLESVTVKDAAGQAPALKILFFRDTPTGTYTDNSAADLSAADIANACGQVNVQSANYLTTDSYSIQTLSDIGLVMRATPGYDLFVVVVAAGAYNAAATSDLSIELGFKA